MSEQYYRTKINRLQYVIARIENIITKDILDEYKVCQIKVILNEGKMKISQIDEHASDDEYFK
jgi:hypothetical protein